MHFNSCSSSQTDVNSSKTIEKKTKDTEKEQKDVSCVYCGRIIKAQSIKGTDRLSGKLVHFCCKNCEANYSKLVRASG